MEAILLFLNKYIYNTEILVPMIVAIIGFVGVMFQMNSAKNVSSAGYDLELQNSFVNNSGFSELFLYCWNKYNGKKYKNYQSIRDIDNYETVLYSYFTFFESIYLMNKKAVIKMSLLDDLFGRRFFVVVNCKEVQDLELRVNEKYYNNIFELYKKWKKYRIKKGNKDLTIDIKRNSKNPDYFVELV